MEWLKKIWKAIWKKSVIVPFVLGIAAALGVEHIDGEMIEKIVCALGAAGC